MKCKVEGCERKVKTNGYCNTHYMRIWYNGSPGGAEIRKRAVELTEEEKDKIVLLVKTTRMSYAQIGELFGISRGPVDKLVKQRGIVRDNIRKNEVALTCDWCKREFYLARGQNCRGRGRFCSKQCYSKWQKTEENRGENHPNWRGGCETELNRLRKRDEWKQWRKMVYERDRYTCQVCGRVGGRLHPHHILKKSAYPEYLFDTRNGITLCKECHISSGIHEKEHGWLALFRKINEAQLMHF